MRSLASCLLLSVLAACGDDTTTTPGTDAGRSDAGRRDGGSGGSDSGTPSDGGGGTDAGSTDGGTAADSGADAGRAIDAGCEPPVCPRPLPGCMYVSDDPCVCGMLVCTSECGDGRTCGPTEYCDYTTPYACSGDGVCMRRPEACIEIYRPVCGCDGVTHSNSCFAHGAGTDYAAEGECADPPPPPPPRDCRTTGCPAGESCEPCRTPSGVTYICLGPGVAC